MVTARSLPLPLPPTALPCLRALPHPGQGLGAPDGSGSPAMQDPATAALRGVPRPLLGSSPTHKPAAAPTSCPVSRTRSPGLRSSSPRRCRLPLCPPGGTRAQILAPKAAGPLAAISCCLGLRMNSQGGRGWHLCLPRQRPLCGDAAPGWAPVSCSCAWDVHEVGQVLPSCWAARA